MSTRMKPIAELVHEVADELRECATAPTELRTLHLRRVASLLVDIREQCEDPAGRGIDWTGRSKAYREAVSAAYREVEDEVSPVRLRQMKSQVRYHFSSIVRERLQHDPEELERFGLQPKSVKQRSGDRIKQRRALEEAGVLEQETEDSNAAARLVHGARYLLELAAEEGLADANQEAREYIRHGLRQMTEAVPELAPPAARIDMARDLLNSVAPESVRGVSDETRSHVDEALTETAEIAHRLRRETTTVEATIDTLDGLLAKYRQEKREGREAG